MEKLISGCNNNGMIDEILKELATLEVTEDVMNKCVLLRVHSVEAQSKNISL